MLTKTDIANLKKIFVTRQEFKYEINRLDKKIDDFREEFREFKDSVLKTLDWLVGAFKKFDEEHLILSSRYTDVSAKIDNHEVRITRLEKKTD